MRLRGLNIHPVKSTAIRPVGRAEVTRAGLRGDREWMVVDSRGVLLSARECPRLFAIRADTPSTDPSVTAALRLSAPGIEALSLATPSTSRVAVRLHSHHLEAVPAGEDADAWLGKALGRADLHLVWCDDPTRRPLNPQYAQPQDHTAFADSSPVSLASTTSLAQLNSWMSETAAERGEPAPPSLPMQRFRANIVVEDVEEAFAEDGWQRLQIGDIPFRTPQPLDRCVMTTIDIPTLDKGKEPIRTLAHHRRWSGKTWFAIKLIPDGEGTIRVGDPVRVLD